MVTYPLDDGSLTPRAAPRRKAFQCITIGTADGESRAHLLDLSRGGARIHAKAQLDVGGTVHLCVEPFALEARIVWADRHMYGLHFQYPISDSDVNRIAG